MNRSKTAKCWLPALLIILAVGFVSLNFLAYQHARAMMKFTHGGKRTSKPEALSFPAKFKVLLAGVKLPRPESARPPATLDPESRALSIDGGGGVTLEAWHVDRGPEAPLVILFHAYSAEKTSLLFEARTFLDLGASVLLVDFRGSGGSSEFYTTLGVREADDVAAAVGYARQHLPHSSLVLFGQSMGSAAILRAVDVHGVDPDGVILEAVFDTMLNTVRNRFHAMGVPSFPSAELLVFWAGKQWSVNGFSHNPVNYARSLNCPSLFMHGARDPRATLLEARRVFDAVPGPKTFVQFDAAGHEPYARRFPDEWRTAVAELIRGSRFFLN